MSLELSPMGVTCNLSCPYCYEHPMREAGNFLAGDAKKPYDVDLMIESLSKHNSRFSLFGGEPLLTAIEDLEKIWKWGYDRYQFNGIQTNGTLITDQHIELFKKYKVHVGISVDGPDELNDTRWAGSLENTRKRTAMSMRAIDRLLEEGHIPSFIVTLHKLNASPERLPRLKDWFREMDRRGVYSSRLHPLEIEYSGIGDTLALSPERNAQVMLEMAELELSLKNLKFDLFGDMKKILLGQDNDVTCTFHNCDPYTTDAVQGVDGMGNLGNCGRSNKEGIDFIKSEQRGYERQMALYHTPQEHGGCKDCRFFIMCKAQCPGTGINQDWRNRTDGCLMFYTLFEHFEKDYLSKGILPLSQSPILKKLEQTMYDFWAQGQRAEIDRGAFKIINNQPTTGSYQEHGDHYDENYRKHGDHTDETMNFPSPEIEYREHGDQHGDAPHGDHTDETMRFPAPTGHQGSEHGDHTDETMNFPAPPGYQVGEHGDRHGDQHGDSDAYQHLDLKR